MFSKKISIHVDKKSTRDLSESDNQIISQAIDDRSIVETFIIRPLCIFEMLDLDRICKPKMGISRNDQFHISLASA